MAESIVAPEQGLPDKQFEQALRPRSLADDEFIGQARVKTRLKILIEAALGRGEPTDHVLLAGPPGLGKTSLAHIIASETGSSIRISSGPALGRPGDLAALLNSLRAGDILFIDEIHRLSKVVEEILYPAMEDLQLDLVTGRGSGAAQRTYRIAIEPFTLVGATTRLGLLSAPLRDRFGEIYRLDYYSAPECAAIINRSASLLEVQIRPEAAEMIATRARGTARVCNRLLRRVRDYCQVKADGSITTELADEALEMLDIDQQGLDEMDRRILATIVRKYDGGPVGINTIAASLSEDPATIEDYHEPYLLQIGYLARTPRGRQATRRAFEHLGLTAPRQAGDPGQLAFGIDP